MKQFPLVLLILLLQETVTINGLLVKVQQGEYSAWLITILFLFMTIFDIILGYILGKFAKHHLNKGKVRAFATTWTHRFHDYIGKHGRRVYLLLLGYFSFPYLNSFITSWLNIPFWESFWYLFFGNIAFYISCWLIVLGVTSLIPNPLIAFAAVIVLTILITICMRIWKSRKV